ncbi:MAG: hypothetical protein PHY72_00150 [Candidatus Pacebacteria bacterium]|nr:hypothetical protein [Candidatus Paceibacterota bacterium]
MPKIGELDYYPIILYNDEKFLICPTTDKQRLQEEGTVNVYNCETAEMQKILSSTDVEIILTHEEMHNIINKAISIFMRRR